MPAGCVHVNSRIDLTQFDALSAIDFLTACRRRGVAAQPRVVEAGHTF